MHFPLCVGELPLCVTPLTMPGPPGHHQPMLLCCSYLTDPTSSTCFSVDPENNRTN